MKILLSGVSCPASINILHVKACLFEFLLLQIFQTAQNFKPSKKTSWAINAEQSDFRGLEKIQCGNLMILALFPISLKGFQNVTNYQYFLHGYVPYSVHYKLKEK